MAGERPWWLRLDGEPTWLRRGPPPWVRLALVVVGILGVVAFGLFEGWAAAGRAALYGLAGVVAARLLTPRPSS